MRNRTKCFAAVVAMLLICPGCEIEDLDGDGFVSSDEIAAAVENWFCGDSEETDAPADEGTETPTAPSTDQPSTDEPLTDPTDPTVP